MMDHALGGGAESGSTLNGRTEAGGPLYSDRVGGTGTSIRDALETVERVGNSSSLLALETVQRLVRTMSAWIGTLEERRSQLAEEVEARTRELEALQRQIDVERRNAEAVAHAATRWAREIESEIADRRSRLHAETESLDAQLQAIGASLAELPGARSMTESSAPMADQEQEAPEETKPPSEGGWPGGVQR